MFLFPVQADITKSLLTRKVRLYIQDHLKEKITVQEIAKSLHMNRTYISDAFRRETGISIGAYVRKRKTAEAERLLQISDLSILDIANQLGFSSQAYFSAFFRRETGMSPAEYRNRAPQ